MGRLIRHSARDEYSFLHCLLVKPHPTARQARPTSFSIPSFSDNYVKGSRSTLYARTAPERGDDGSVCSTIYENMVTMRDTEPTTQTAGIKHHLYQSGITYGKVRDRPHRIPPLTCGISPWALQHRQTLNTLPSLRQDSQLGSCIGGVASLAGLFYTHPDISLLYNIIDALQLI